MHSSAILREARQLRNVSDSLDSLAEQHPLVSGALITISGNIRHTAVLLGGASCDETGADLQTRSSRCMIYVSSTETGL
jgi:hypothetical protein